MWAGHYSIRIMIPALVGIIAFTVAGRPGGDNGVLSWIVTVAWLVWFVTVMLDYNYHEARLCERCIAATPLDPQKAVTRWDWVLRLFHSKKILFAVSLGLTVWFFAGPVLAHHHWWGYAISVVAFVLLGVLVTSIHVHRRLYPWCPYCRWGGRGEEEEVVPDPDPAASAS